MENPQVDIVMPVWATDHETIQITEAAVESLKGSGRLIVVDNGSTVGGGQLRGWADLYVRNKENLGYAKAVNQGLKLAGDLVAVANNDIRVSPNWEEVALSIFDSSVKNSKLRGMPGSVHFRMIPYNQPFNPGTETWVEGKERWCSSSFFVMQNVQFYDENFLNSLDDWDFWRRFREDHYATVYTNKAEYQHLDSYTQQKIPSRADNDNKNLQYYFKKWGETPDEWMARVYPEQLAQPWKPFP